MSILAACAALMALVPTAHADAATSEARWHLGESLSSGDSFTYDVCAGSPIPRMESQCFLVVMDFVDVLWNSGSPEWVVQARFGDADGSWSDAMLRIDASGTFDISSSAEYVTLSSIIEDSVFSMRHYAPVQDPQSLITGARWDAHQIRPLHVGSAESVIVDGREMRAIPLEHLAIEGNSIRIVDEFPFPVSGVIYHVLRAPILQLEFSFELVSYSTASKSGSSGPADPERSEDPIVVYRESATDKAGALHDVLSDPRGLEIIAQLVCRSLGELDLDPYNAELLCGVHEDGSAISVATQSEEGTTIPERPHYVSAGAACNEASGVSECYHGSMTGVGDGASMLVDDRPVRLALILPAGDDHDGFGILQSELLAECPLGSTVTVDIDDAQPAGASGIPAGVVYCDAADVSINAALVLAGHAVVSNAECSTSEFAHDSWVLQDCGS